MFLTKKINKELVAVIYDSATIYVRKSGKKYYRTEEMLCGIENGKLVIDGDVATKYGIDVVFKAG